MQLSGNERSVSLFSPLSDFCKGCIYAQVVEGMQALQYNKHLNRTFSVLLGKSHL